MFKLTRTKRTVEIGVPFCKKLLCLTIKTYKTSPLVIRFCSYFLRLKIAQIFVDSESSILSFRVRPAVYVPPLSGDVWIDEHLEALHQAVVAFSVTERTAKV